MLLQSGIVIFGDNFGDNLGRSLASMGDVNGDGIDDIFVGAPFTGSLDNGEAHVIFGAADLGLNGPLNADDLDGVNGFTLVGDLSRDQAGRSLSSADINNDGTRDLIIGAPGGEAFSSTSRSGETYVVFGGAGVGASGSINLGFLDSADGFILRPDILGEESGYAVSGMGDVNGDGIDDLLIGAPLATPGDLEEAGKAYVVFGGPGVGSDGLVDLSALDGSDGFVVTGGGRLDMAGHSVSAADLNGDGLDDLIIGAYNDNTKGRQDAGEIAVVFGAAGLGASGEFSIRDLDGSNGFSIAGPAAFAAAGKSVSNAGDMNGDGVDDVIVGAPFVSVNGQSNVGAAYVVFGDGGGGFPRRIDTATLDGSDGFALNGIAQSDLAGASVSAAGDVNGDGYDDVLVGANWADPNGRDFAGEAYLVFGGPSVGAGGTISLAGLDGADGYRFNGVATPSEAGAAVSGAGDVNSDGVDDLMIGASFAVPEGGERSGAAYVVFGGAEHLAGLDAADDVVDGVIELAHIGGELATGDGDVLDLGNGGDFVFTLGGADAVQARDGDDRIYGNAGDDRLGGNAGADALFGGADDDILRGHLGGDTLDGGAGADLLFGGSGDDRLIDGEGEDKLIGGDGADIFELALDGQVDRIRDYADGIDKIALTGVSFADLTITDLASGDVRIRYGNEKLNLADGSDTLGAADLTEADFMFS